MSRHLKRAPSAQSETLLEDEEIAHRFEVTVERRPLRDRGADRHATPVAGRPLVVDLDGTLVASDLLIETAFSELGRRPKSLVDMVRALANSKAALKHRLAEPAD